MASEIPPAASQPVAQAQNSDGKGSNNISAASLQAMLVQGSKPTEEAAKEPEAIATDTPQEGLPETSQEQSTTEPEVTAEEVVTPDPENDEESSFTTKLSPEQQAVFDKAIGKKVAKQKAAEEAQKAAEDKAAALEARLAELEKATPPEPTVVHAPSPDNPLANVNDVKGLAERQKDAREIKTWAEDFLDSDQADSGIMVGDKLMSKADVKKIAREAQRTLEEHIPKRAQFLQAKQASDARAREVFPWMANKSSSEYQQAQAALRDFPFLASMPNASEVIGIQILGMQKLAEMQAAKSKPVAPKPKAPASQTSVSSTGTPTRTSDDTLRKAKVQADIESFSAGKRNFSASDAVALLKKSSSLNQR